MSTTDAETELRLTSLPVSGQNAALRTATGADDLLLLEIPTDDLALALALLGRLAQPADGAVSNGAAFHDWSYLTATDLDFLILRLRQSTLGDRVIADVKCRSAECGQRIDISFGIDQYIAHHIPARSQSRGRRAGPEPVEEPGWYRLADNLFRLPTTADLLAVAG